MDRLKAYYEFNQIQVIAEFYIEDHEEVLVAKMHALQKFLA